jgi:hypothetical protein
LETPGNALPSPISLHKQGLTFIEGQGSACCVNNSHEALARATVDECGHHCFAVAH